MRTKRTTALLVGVIAAVAAAFAANVHAAAKASTITIWADNDRKAAVTQLANQWAQARGATANVVFHDFGKIRDDLATVAAAEAPDVIMGAHDWTGQLAANGLVQPLVLSGAAKAQFPAYTLNAFSYGTAVKRLYGIPTQIENIGLVVNTGLVKVPKTFKQLEAEALAFKKKSRATSQSPCSRARTATRTTCTRSSRGSAATSSARTRPETSTRRTSAWRIRSSSRTLR